jgi:hypothetical protein
MPPAAQALGAAGDWLYGAIVVDSLAGQTWFR